MLGTALGSVPLFAALVAGCAHASPGAYHRIHRGDWVVASEGARRVLLLWADLQAGIRAGRPYRIEVGEPAPDLLAAPAEIRLHRGEVRTFALRGEPLAALEIAGGAVRVYWTEPRGKARASRVHLEAVAPGRARLRLLPLLAPARTLSIEVGDQ